MSGTLFVVATPIGNLEDVTARALRVLREVSLVAAEDTRRTHKLLARYAIATPTVSLHEHNEARKLPVLVERLKRGEPIAIVSDAGTPTISDPGQRLIRAAIEAGIRVEPVPGPSAVVAAVAASGFPGDSFTFLGFAPSRSKDRKQWVARLASRPGLAVFFEAPHRILKTLGEILQSVGDREVAIARELTKVHEEFLRGPISSVLSQLQTPIGEFTVVIQIGQTTDIGQNGVLKPNELASKLGQLIDIGRQSKRVAIRELAKKHGVTTNQLYRMLEQHKK